MSITSISRDWGTNPSIVRVVSTDALSVITASGYLTAQDANIKALNNGSFEWLANDIVAISYSDGESLFTRNATTLTFDVGGAIAPSVLQYKQVAITAAEFNGMYAAPKELVAAPGANLLLVLDRVQLLETYGSAAFAGGGVAAVQYDSTINGAGIIASSTLSAATFQVTASTAFNFNAGVVAQPFATAVNKNLSLSNVTGAFTSGDSDLVAHVWYKVIASA